jgi:error-prone DNA polymerase
MLNSQPMGFYAPAQLVRDAREHGVKIHAVDVNHSEWDSTLEPTAGGRLALRLGLRQAKGFREADAIALLRHRGGGYRTVQEVWHKSGLTVRALEVLANADAWGSIGLSRRDASWQIKRLSGAPLPLFEQAEAGEGRFHNAGPVESAFEPSVILPAMTAGEQVIEDYRHLMMSLKTHPVALLRGRFTAEGIAINRQLAQIRDGTRVAVSGLVLIRQQPGTASGVIFMTIEDETGVANIVVWPSVFERYRAIVLGSRLVGIHGRVQRDESGKVIHVVAERMVDLSHHLDELATPLGLDSPAIPGARKSRWDHAIGSGSRDFH